MLSNDLMIKGRVKDLGGFQVARSIPSPERRFIGPFVFLDHMGPMEVTKTQRVNVRPHPHIGLATVTYLFQGQFHHRDSLGTSKMIQAGDLNLMTAGRGIVHSERSPESGTLLDNQLHGVQIWLALPVEQEDCPPSFRHYEKSQLPELNLVDGIKGKLLMGEHDSIISPVHVYGKTFFAEFLTTKNIEVILSFDEEEIGIFIVQGEAKVNGKLIRTNDLLIVSDPQRIELVASSNVRFIILGGRPHQEPRFIWWNFVSSSKDKIRIAADRWQKNLFEKVPGDHEYIPLPHDPLP